MTPGAPGRRASTYSKLKSVVQKPVYLDYQATTPLDERVLDAMLPYLRGKFGNAASRTHQFGWEAEKAVDFARKRVATLAGAGPREIVFTSGATESNNLAIKGARGHVVTVATEHRAVLDPAGPSATIVPVDLDGLVNVEELRRAIRPDTVLVSVMYANNEVGTIQPVAAIGAMCRERGVLFHCDAAQAFGKIPVDVQRDSIDLMSLSAHKLYGPKGVGALYVRRGVKLAAQMEGGGHEGGLRSGTLNVPGIVGFGAACTIARDEMADEAQRVGALRDRLQLRLTTELDQVRVNGALAARLPGNLNVTFGWVAADSLLMALPDLALSTGSACSSAESKPSHVLTAMGRSLEEARSSVRFGLGRFTTAEEVEYAAARVIEAVGRLRALSTLMP